MDFHDHYPTDLLQTWMRLTEALVSTGHAADLYQALNRACGSSTAIENQRVNGLNPHDETPQVFSGFDKSMNITSYVLTQPPTVVASDTPQEMCYELMNVDDEQSLGDTVTASSPAPSNSTELDDWLGISSSLVDASADLAIYRGNNSSQTFEEIFTAQESILDDMTIDPIEPHHVYTRALSPTSQVAPTLTSKDLCQPVGEDILHNIGDTASQNEHNEASRQQSPCARISLNAVPIPEARISQSRRISQGIKKHAKRMKQKDGQPVRTSAKKDLLKTEISLVARSLIQQESINFFLDNYKLILDELMSSIVPTALLSSPNSVEEPVIAAFDMLHSLRKRKDSLRILLRFAYIQLIRAVDARKEAARKDRVYGRTPRRSGHSDATIAIDTYLKATENKAISRVQLSEYIRIGTRWSALAGFSPIILFLYSAKAETIINNNSIKLTSLDALAAQVQHLFPELARATMLHQSAELAFKSGIEHGIPQIQERVKSIRDSLLSEPKWAGSIYPTLPIGRASSSSDEEEALHNID